MVSEQVHAALDGVVEACWAGLHVIGQGMMAERHARPLSGHHPTYQGGWNAWEAVECLVGGVDAW